MVLKYSDEIFDIPFDEFHIKVVFNGLFPRMQWTGLRMSKICKLATIMAREDGKSYTIFFDFASGDIRKEEVHG
jgi:hypothetical protein